MSIDERLNEALRSYTGEPPEGLERRVLAAVRKPAPRRWYLPIAASLVLAATASYWLYNPEAPPLPPLPAGGAAFQAADPLSSGSSRPKGRLAARKGRPTKLPQRDVFPTPVPLSAEERALVAFVRSAPDEALEFFTPKPIEPTLDTE